MSAQERIEADAGWLAEHSLEITHKYAGKWIAVHQGKIVGVGVTAVEAADKARTVCADGDFILEAVDDNADVIYGVL